MTNATTTYQECLITPCASGFGEFQCGEANGVEWEDDDELRDAMAEAVAEGFGEMVELGRDPLPEWAQDIRGLIHNEPSRVFAVWYPNESPEAIYYGIVERS
jgi:hypothetical protein